MIADFVHLRVHSAYSLSEGAIRIKDLAKLCQKAKMPAVAITDTDNLYGALEFAVAAREAGIQPIIGCQISLLAKVQSGLARSETQTPTDKIILLVQSDAGYRNLLKLVSHAHLKAQDTEAAHLSLDDLKGFTDGLICLSGGAGGPIGRAALHGHADAAEDSLKQLQALFPQRLYMELMRHGLDDERRTETQLIDLAYKYDVPLVATNDCFFADASLYEAHDALLCIAAGAYIIQDERRRATPEHYFKSAAEMRALFADLPEAVDNTVTIARRCSFLLKPVAPILPRFPTKLTEEEALRTLSKEGLEQRLQEHVFTADMDAAAKQSIAKPYRERLDYELGVITQMKFPGYFLIVADFIRWAKGQGIPVGPGRGSGAGSVVAWSLTITDLDPLRFGLLFERFLNPERVSMPDFDIDFCQDRRDEVIAYVSERYGSDRVAQIITFGKLQARAVLRDVGRVMQLPYGQVDRICKLVPNNPAKPVTLGEAIDGEPQLQAMRDSDEQVARMMDIALKLEGLYRHASTHAAGVVIGDRPLDQLIPLTRDQKSGMLVTQFNMKYVEQAGLVKFDFLGLKTLTVLQQAEQLVRASGHDIDIEHLPLDDEKTFALLTRAEGMGVFQLESSGMRDALRRLKPNRIEDIIALVALYRPGPMDNIPKYCRVKDGAEAADYLHPLLEPILKETFGIMVYQEQVMEIAQKLAGYSLGSADLLRRAMGKKIKSEMEAQRQNFIDGAAKMHAIDATQAGTIFDLVAKFADYGFNKSHAAAYALIAYQTAYLKANYAVEFLAACMTLDMRNTDKLASFRQELVRARITLLPPDINRSEVAFAVETQSDGTKAIRYALAAIKGVGAQAMESVVADRKANGAFKDLSDFAQRLDGRSLNKRQLEGLAHAGAFDTLNRNRAQVFKAAELILKQAVNASDERQTGQVNLFGGGAVTVPELPLPLVATYDALEQLRHEFSAVGFYLSAHPLDSHVKALRRLGVVSFSDVGNEIRANSSSRVKLAGVVAGKQERTSAKGNRFAFIQMSDVSAVYEVMVFSELLAQHRSLLEPGQTLVISVDVQRQGEEMRLTAQSIEKLERAVANVASSLHIRVNESVSIAPFKAILDKEASGKSRINLSVSMPDETAILIDLPGAWMLSTAARTALQAISGVLEVEEL